MQHWKDVMAILEL